MSPTVTEHGDRIELAFPPRARTIAVLVSLALLIGGIVSLWFILQDGFASAPLQAVLGVSIMAVLGAVGLAQAYLQRTRLEVSSSGADLIMTWGFVRIIRRYDAAAIRYFRASRANTGYSVVPALAFDYGARTVRFAHGVKPDESDAVLALVRRRFPQLLSAATAARFSP